MNEANFDMLNLIEQKIVYELFELEKISYKSLVSFLKKSTTIARYFKESNLNTDNAWVEHTVINLHDSEGEFLSNVTLKVWN